MKNLAFFQRRFLLIFLVFLSFYVIGCEKLPFDLSFLTPKSQVSQEKQELPSYKVTGTVVARVNNMPIALEDLNDAIEEFNSMVPENQAQLKITTREQKIDYLKNDMKNRALVYQEAIRRGLDKNPDIQRILEKTKQDLLVLELLRQEGEKATATYQEIENYYNTNKDLLKTPEERHILEIVVPTELAAKEILIQLLQGADFASLAKERSIAKSSQKGGDLGWITGEGMPKEFNDVAFSNTLEAGKTSSVFKGPDGWYVVKLEGKRGGEQQSLSDLWDGIKAFLTYDKSQKELQGLIDSLGKNAKVEFYEGAIQ